ncbi:MAG: glycoside hydrolase family 9 protein [Coprobacillaceae bacterium]
MKKTFIDNIINSGYLHRPLKLEEERTFEEKNRNHKINNEQILLDSKSSSDYKWNHRNQGKSFCNQENEIVLEATSRMPTWPPGAPEDGDYSNFGQVTTYCELPRLDLRGFNRIYFEIYVNYDGAVNPHIMVGIKNDGEIKIPDIYNREGYHTVNLKNYQWNECFLEISDLPRDAITELSFTSLLNGQDRATSEEMQFKIRKVLVQSVENSSISKGWLPKDDEIIYSHNGYHHKTNKTAFLKETKEKEFQLIDSKTNTVVFEKEIVLKESHIGEFYILDFTEYQNKGDYYLNVGNLKTEVFTIDNYMSRWHESIWRSLNFIFCERCGCPVPDKHGSCHEDIIARHKDKTIIFNGGWHDAGDVSQQLVQTAEVTQSLFEIAKVVKDQDQQLYLRLLEEAEWGFDFILKTRFGDGYRATSAGITIWSDGFIGNMDDMKARVHNNAYENFFLSGMVAQIASHMDDSNRLKQKAITVAIEDYNFALRQFEIDGFKHEPIFWEHTYSTSESLYLATMSWTSSMLYKLTKDETYAKNAELYMDELLACQQTSEIDLDSGEKLKGFFYRDKRHLVVQHFNHQAREHLYAQALDGVMETQPNNKKYIIWENSMKMYGEYLIYLMQYTDPYPMIASGVYKEDEPTDEESFHKQHLLVGEEAKEDYKKQLELGHKIAPSLYVKKFPVWFSFKGNNGILLSMGKSASVIGKRLKIRKLIELAEGQLQWMVGMNPFGQSLVYGEGYNYAQQYSVLTGEMVGEMPVGIQTFGNEDEPYWPQLNNATYKEVWVGLAGKWMSIIIDLYLMENGED